MQVLGLVASPHGAGSTTTAVRAVLDGAAGEGHETRLLDAATTSAAEVVSAVERADAVVLGSPVYRATHTAVMSAVLESLQRGMSGESGAPLQATAVALVMTAASEAHLLATERLRSTLACFFGAQTLSPALFFDPGHFTAHKELTGPATELARLHGRALAELAAAIRGGTALGQLRPLV